MDNLELVRHLYDEEPLRPLEEVVGDDPEEKAAYERLAETRDWVASRPAALPDPSVIDAVVGLAARSAAGGRSPASPPLRLVRLLRPVTWAAAACLVAVAGYWVGRQSVVDRASIPYVMEKGVEEAVGQRDQAESAPEIPPALADYPAVEESARRATPPTTAPQPAPALAGVGRSSLPSARVADVGWEGAEDLFVIRTRVLSLEEALSGVEWDQAVPLGALQAGGAQPYEGAAATGDSAVRRPPH